MRNNLDLQGPVTISRMGRNLFPSNVAFCLSPVSNEL